MEKSAPKNFFKLKKPHTERITCLFENPLLVNTPNYPVIRLFQIKKYKTVAVYLGVAVSICLLTTTFSFVIPVKAKPTPTNKYFIYSSKPLTLETTTFDVAPQDDRAQRIDGIFRKYKCPIEGMGQVFVREADKNGIPWWLVASVAFQESTCGKNTPTVDGQNSYNAWGWEIYGQNTHSFDNWARGIEVVSAYFSDRFFSQGVTDLCDIMKIYTPPSNGSWCKGVGDFSDLIQNYQTPSI